MTLLPGEVYWAFLDKNRPFIVLSREELNRGEYVLVAPLTTAHLAQRRSLPNCVAIQGQLYALKDSVVQAEMITVLSRSDLVDVDKGSIAMLTGETMRELIRAVGFVIQADCEPV